MSRIKYETAYAKKQFLSFGGIRTPAGSDGSVAADMRNFRICSGGILKKRNGWSKMQPFANTIRGVWQGRVQGEAYFFLVTGGMVFNLPSKKSRSLISTLYSTEGPVEFLRYKDTLYLADGMQIWKFDPAQKKFVEALGYVPLYGYNWHPSQLGPINEPLNLLNTCLRIHYKNTSGSTLLYLPFPAKRVNSVRINNVQTGNYSFSSGSDRITLSSASVGDIVEVAITLLAKNDLQEQLQKARAGFVFRDGGQEHLLLYGAPQGYRLFISSEVSQSDLTYCSVFFSDCDPLYLKQKQVCLIGDEDHPITAICPNLDRLLVFHSAGAHSLTLDGEQVFSYPVLHNMGCSGRNAIALMGKDPIVINESGICKLHSTVSDPESFTVTILSQKIKGLLTPSFCKNACLLWDPASQELWVRDTAENTAGLVWVWNAESDDWYLFDNIFATLLFPCEGEVAFCANSDFCAFDSTQYDDENADIHAYYKSSFLSLASHTPKKSARASVCMKACGNSVTLSLSTERGSGERSFQSKDREAPELFEMQIAHGRFRLASLCISCKGKKNAEIYEANLFTTR